MHILSNKWKLNIHIYWDKNNALLITYREMQTYNETIIMKYWMNSERLEIQQTYTEQSRAHISLSVLTFCSAKLYLITFSTKEMLWYNMHCPTRLRCINISFLLRVGPEASQVSLTSCLSSASRLCKMTHRLTAVILSSSQRWSILSQTVSQNKPLLL